MSITRLKADSTALLIVDMQQKLIPVIDCSNQLIRQTARLIQGAKALGVPVIVTQQYPKGLGETIDELQQLLTNAPDDGGASPRDTQDASNLLGVFDKLKFSAYVPSVQMALEKNNIKSIVVAGIEAHVCVLQTCFDLLDAGYVTAVAHDAVGSRHHCDQQVALGRMNQVGVVGVTVESVLFELTCSAENKSFKAVSNIIK